MRFSLILAISCIPFASWATTIEQSQCIAPIPAGIASEQPHQGDSNDPAIRVNADRSQAVAGDSATFTGKVELLQGARRIRTENAGVNQQDRTFSASGGLIYEDPDVTISAQTLNADVDANQAELSQARYWLNGQQVHGTAQLLEIQQNNDIELTNATFTTCAEAEPAWELEAESITLDSATEWGEIWHAKVNMFGVPVFYVPYMTVPVTDKRKSGFLFPSLSSSSKNGIDVSVPYYWNIAPNLDATLTTQYMSKRGTFFSGIGRYLQPWGAGQVNLEYIGNDRLTANNDERYLFHIEHAGRLDENWRLYADYTHISDDNYFTDLDSSVNDATDNQISREGEVSYFNDNWNMALKVQDIEVLGDVERPFQVMPSLNFNYYQYDLAAGLKFDFNTELTNFAHRDDEHLTATRWHFEPTLTLPYQTPEGGVTAEVKLMQTFYQQDDPSDVLDSAVSRTLPQLRLHGQVNFERDFSLGGNRYLQTLEPQIQYLYVPYEDQSDIGLYDTALLQEDYLGLFRDRRFSGLDRISDANQLTVGLSSRILDNGLHETAELSIGQIFYFQDAELTLNNSNERRTQSSSALAVEGQWQINKRWYTEASLQFDSQSGDTNKSELLLNYQVDDNRLVQLSHRYVPDLGTDENGRSIDISQTGMRATWPVAKDIYFVGNYYYDTNLSRSIETYAGLQYESCCWAIQLAYYRELNTNYEGEDFTTISQSNEFDSGIRLNFVLKGLGSTGPLGVKAMRDEGQFNFRKPYYLRN
ncbi:LPS assembly protein LptD [uncultured Ferrimonas sp.]|uniref:LPS assembly protein LptD n=1 Tax=uncultured Ferrimonas sp. TaxID=432640 RepID=UPI002619ED5B|nr:LPS assembly protein LptD [uncultured Ferrimonas sp.]